MELCKAIPRAVLVALAMALLPGCSTEPDPVAAESPDYLFERVASVREASAGLVPRTLAESLPNHQYVIPTGESFQVSDVVVYGRIVEVSKGEARAHSDSDDDYEVVDFDDPTADERTLNVSIAVEEMLGDSNAIAPEVVTFRLGLLGAESGDEYIGAVKALDQVVVVLSAITDGRDVGTLIPALQGALIGEADDAGSLSFPGLGADEKAFVGELHTLDALRSQAESDGGSTTLE